MCVHLSLFTWNHTCTGVTGTMIENCVRSVWAEFLTDDPAAWKVRVGEHYMFREDASQMDIDIERILFHPDRDRASTHCLFTYIGLSAEIKVKCDCGRIHCPVAESQIIISWKNIANMLSLQENKKIERKRETDRKKEWKKESIGLQVMQSYSLLFLVSYDENLLGINCRLLIHQLNNRHDHAAELQQTD